MKYVTLLFLLLLLMALPEVTYAQRVVGVCPESADSLAMNPAIRGGPEQIAEIKVTLSYVYAQGDTTHASPAEAATIRYSLMDSTGAEVVQSGNCDVLLIPQEAMTNAEKILGRSLMDAFRDALKYYVPDLND